MTMWHINNLNRCQWWHPDAATLLAAVPTCATITPLSPPSSAACPVANKPVPPALRWVENFDCQPQRRTNCGPSAIPTLPVPSPNQVERVFARICLISCQSVHGSCSLLAVWRTLKPACTDQLQVLAPHRVRGGMQPSHAPYPLPAGLDTGILPSAVVEGEDPWSPCSCNP
jgi:hypothetical protein